MKGYADLRLYVGPVTNCLRCGRQFRLGEVVTVDCQGRQAFCLTDNLQGGCQEDYYFEKRPDLLAQALDRESMVYREKNASGVATPEPARSNPLAVGCLIVLGILVTLISTALVYRFFIPGS